MIKAINFIMLDKILLILLLTLLPLGVFVVSTKIKNDTNSLPEATVKKFDAAIEQLSKQVPNNNGSTKQPQFNITGVINNPDTQTLTIAGTSPTANNLIWAWYSAETETDGPAKLQAKPSPSPLVKVASPANFTVRGPFTTVSSGGSFSLSIDVANLQKVVEIILKQGEIETIIKFDLSTNKQLIP
jgi:hypothetical protein